MIDMRIIYTCFFAILFLGCGAQHKINYTLMASGVYDDGFGHSYKSDQPLTAAPTVEYQIKEDVVGGMVKKVDIVFGINGDSASSFDGKTETVLAKLEDEYNFSFFIPYKRVPNVPVEFHYHDKPLGAWTMLPSENGADD